MTAGESTISAIVPPRWRIAVAAGVVGIGAAAVWHFLGNHKLVDVPERCSQVRQRSIAHTREIVARTAVAAAEVQWRGWLKTRITAKGAEPHHVSSLGSCVRCGDPQGLPHECRDLAR